MGRVLHAAQIPEELIHVDRRPLPRILIRGLLEPRHQPLPAFDSAKRQIPAQLLIPPPGEHLGEHDILRVEETHCAEIQNPSR
jgi:hypothetical protein